jgi:hypothetical protein
VQPGWCHRFGLLTTPGAEQRYLFSQVAAHVYPDASPDGLDLGFGLMGWFFPFDDQLVPPR